MAQCPRFVREPQARGATLGGGCHVACNAEGVSVVLAERLWLELEAPQPALDLLSRFTQAAGRLADIASRFLQGADQCPVAPLVIFRACSRRCTGNSASFAGRGGAGRL